MCYYVDNNLTKKEIKNSFGVRFNSPDFQGSEFTNGFTFPKTPVILNQNLGEAVLADWGLIPFWAKSVEQRKSTLNARIETLLQKKSFAHAASQRCLVLVNGFYEWKWLDSKGKRKEKYFIRLNNNSQPFALGGIYDFWWNKETDVQILSFSIVTSDANELMSEIHNTKDRMPLVLTKDAEKVWLENQPLEEFLYPNFNPDLLVKNCDEPTGQLALF